MRFWCSNRRRKNGVLFSALLRAVSIAAILPISVTPVFAQSSDAGSSTIGTIEALERPSVTSGKLTTENIETLGSSLIRSSISDDFYYGQYDLTPYQSLSRSLDEALSPVPSQLFNSSTLDLDFSDTFCAPGSEQCGFDNDKLDLDLSTAINTDKPGGVDLQIIPRAALSFGDEHRSALLGATFKIGEDLRELDPNDNSRWYLFAGADAEALTYQSGDASRLWRGQFNLQDKIIVGDAQAGFGYKIGDTDISLAYIRRDVNSFSFDEPGVSYTEDAAALSLTWRR